jgi:putative transposase
VYRGSEMAVAQRRPARGVIHHSEHGSQPALLFTGRCEQAGISISMGSVGDCFDNAVCAAVAWGNNWVWDARSHDDE